MDLHPHFDLRLHDNDELGELVGSPVVERSTLHEWPLSCVQRITDANGQCYIYKAQREPSLEDQFYASARSSLLPGLKATYREGAYLCLIVEFIDGVSLNETELTPDVALELAPKLLTQITGIKGKLPVFRHLDVDHWPAFQQEMVEGLRGLAAADRFVLTGGDESTAIQATLESNDVLDRIGGEVDLLHGDLTPDNIIVTPIDYRIIDWQYPRIGPRQIDLAMLLDGLDIDPRPHVQAGIMPLVTLIRIHWLMACASRWFPPGAPTYDREIARLVSSL